MRTYKRMAFVLGATLLSLLAVSLLPLASTPIAQAGRSGQASANWLESDDTLVVQQGDWQTVEAGDASGGSYLSAGDQSSVLYLSFEGAIVHVKYATGPDMGTLAVEVDNTVLRTVVATADSAGFDSVVIDYLDSRTHLLEVYPVDGTAAVDAFYAAAVPTENLPEDGPATIDVPGDSGPTAGDNSPSVTATLTAPTGLIYSSTPNFTFTLDFPGDPYFYISVVRQLDSAEMLGQWFTSPPYCVSGSCVIRPPTLALGAGVYRWKVKTFTGSVERPFSSDLLFEVDRPNPVAPFGIYEDFQDAAGNVTFKWDGTDAPLRETWYEVLVIHTAPQPDIMLKDVWFEGSTIDCLVQCRGNISSFDNSFSLLFNQAYQWWVRAWGTEGYGPWVGPINFVMNMPPPDSAPIPTVPQEGTVVTDTHVPEFAWLSVERASFYRLIIQPAAGGAPIWNTWYTRVALGCYTYPYSEVECSVPQGTLPVSLANGNYVWRVETYGPGGNGALNTGNIPFSVQVLASVLTPTGLEEAINSGDVIFEWPQDDRVEWYHFFLQRANNTLVFQSWYQVSALCNGVTCSIGYIRNINGGGLQAGSYNWALQAFNADVGISNFSAARVISVTGGVPGTPNPTTFKPPSTPAQAENHLVYEWNEVANAIYYQLWVGQAGVAKLDAWFVRTNESVINCDGVKCSVQPNLYLGPGTYQMFVRAYGTGGMGAFSTAGNFTVGGATVAAHTYTSPINGTQVTTPDPNLVWNQGSGALYYELYLQKTNPVTRIVWAIYTVAEDDDELTCLTNVCTLDLDLTLTQGPYQWFIRGYGPGEIDPWDSGQTFSVTPAAPVAPELNSPAEDGVNGTTAVTFSWEVVPFAAWYNVEFKLGTVTTPHWFNAAVVCNETTCTATVPSVPAGKYTWRVQGWSSLPTNGFGAFSTARVLYQLVRVLP